MNKIRDTISYEAVAQAMAAISGAGEKPTVRRVQAEVGGGSHTTLLAHIKRYNDEQRAALAAGPAAGILTPEVSAALVGWVKQREEGARQDADQRVAEVDELYRAAKEGWEKADARIEELEAEQERARSKAADEIQALKSETAVLQARIAGNDKHIVELKEQLQREQQSSESSRFIAAEAKIKAEAAQESIKTLGKANEELRADARSQSKALGEAAQRAAVAEERSKSRDEQLAELRGRAQTDAADLHQRLKEAAKVTESLRERLDDAQKELSAAQRDLAICREQHQGGTGGRRGGGQGGGTGSSGVGDSVVSQAGKAGTDGGPSHRSQSSEQATSAGTDEEGVNVTMRRLGKPSTPQEIRRSMDALLSCAPKLGHELHRGQAPKTRTHPAPR